MALVEIARFYDLSSAWTAESFLRGAGLDPSVADDVLTTMNPLLLRAVGGLRLSVPADQVEVARDLLARAEAGEFTASLEEEDRIAPRDPSMPAPVVGLLAVLMPEAAYGGLRRGGGGDLVRRIALVAILVCVTAVIALTVYGWSANGIGR